MKNPYAGGAEVVNEQLAKRLVADGHEVIFLVRGFAGAKKEEMVGGYKIIRVGDYHMVYWEAYKYYKKNLQGWADLVIEEVNTIPFFCNWYVKEKNVLYFNQLCREIWFYEMGLVKGLIGYLLEPIYLMFLGNRKVIAISKSTKKDLNRFGFRWKNIDIISMGLEIDLAKQINQIKKFENPTILSLGAMRSMKRTDHIVEAFELAKKEMSDLQLIVAGNIANNTKVLKMIEDSPYKDSIRFLGRVSREKKMELMQKAHLIAVTSVKEGWGLIVTEANSQGTPAVVYDIDGLRDAVKNNATGFICEKNTPENLAEKIKFALENKEEYEKIRQNGWNWSKNITFDQSYNDFDGLLKGYVEEKESSILKKARAIFAGLL